METQSPVAVEASRRRTFAIISHPDAGKTTLTEKFLLYTGKVAEAGAVQARAGRRAATSDWMQMEQQRGISIASTVLQLRHRDTVINLLDTPGHRDFSEDTYRVLAAVDAAVMVLDVAKGIEAQTLKLFEVCRARSLPIIIFINKLDRPGRDALELLDEIEEKIKVKPTPITWPVGIPGEFQGVIDRQRNEFVSFARSTRGATKAEEQRSTLDDAIASEGEAFARALDECSLLDEVGATYDRKTFLAGETAPLFVGSAMTNFGVSHLLDAVIDMLPPPSARADVEGHERPLDADCAGFVFKIQANMDPGHRDHVAFIRLCSGRFERGMTVTHQPSGKAFSTKYAMSVTGAERSTVEEAFPGDVVGLVNASDLRIGDTFYAGKKVTFPTITAFAPELFATVLAKDTSKHKQFRSGLAQLGREGVVQVMTDPKRDGIPYVAAVGQMQFEVLSHRMENEFGAAIELSHLPYNVACRTDEATADALNSYRSARVLQREDGVKLALFESQYFLNHLRQDNPGWVLEPIVTN